MFQGVANVRRPRSFLRGTAQDRSGPVLYSGATRTGGGMSILPVGTSVVRDWIGGVIGDVWTL